MLARITAVEPIYLAPPGSVGVYQVWVEFRNRGTASFTQQFLVQPRVGETWEMTEPRLELLKNHPDGTPR
jgi:hypothetical protein